LTKDGEMGRLSGRVANSLEILERLSRQIKIQLAIFSVVFVFSVSVMVFHYMQAPTELFGIGRYTVTVQLPQAAGLYKKGNVVYRGVEVGEIKDVRLTTTGAEAVLSLKRGIDIPADLSAEVHSVSAVGEQYVALLPRTGAGPVLTNGSVIPADRTSTPPDINSLLAATVRGLNAIPGDNLKAVVDDGYVAFAGLGPDLSRLIKGSTTLASDARKNLDPILTLIDGSKPLLDSQIESSDAIHAWASHLATVTSELRNKDSAVAGLLQRGAPAADEARKLVERLQPTLPIVLANLVSIGQVGITYRDNLEALLVELPDGTAVIQGTLVADKDTKSPYAGDYLSFNLNLNMPPPCTTGFLPAQQRRAASYQDAPDVPAGNFYCRIPQDSPLTAVRGARNLPCETRPGKRAATVKLCESDEPYIPLNDGFDWRGDPNGTYTGQRVPQLDPVKPPPGAGPEPPPIAAVQYDPATGMYVGPDGHMYAQHDLARGANKEKTWQSMLTPPVKN
jgi:phospholipid/cholesterol/gamma-HCH transport system substrate-binding protein